MEPPELASLLESLSRKAAEAIRERLPAHESLTVYADYNAATWHATHRMRSYRTAFVLLARINRAFQERFPLS